MVEEKRPEAAGNPYGEEIHSWLIDEYERHERGPLWYAIAFIVGVGMVLYAMITQNFLFAIIVIMGGIIVGLSSMREPRRLLFQMTSRGVLVGDEFVPYKNLKSFWILYDPPHTKCLYLDFRNSITPHIRVALEDQDPLKVRSALLEFLHEESSREGEPISELLGRVLKL